MPVFIGIMEASGCISIRTSLITVRSDYDAPSLFYREIPLTQGQVAIVDVADYDWLSEFKWYAAFASNIQSFYAVRRSGHDRVYMHREILGLVGGDKRFGDHISGDTLDNRRSNLRVATHAENKRNQCKQKNNTSGYKGVCWYVNQGWIARITVDNKRIFLGSFQTAEEAHIAYCKASIKYHGRFSRAA